MEGRSYNPTGEECCQSGWRSVREWDDIFDSKWMKPGETEGCVPASVEACKDVHGNWSQANSYGGERCYPPGEKSGLEKELECHNEGKEFDWSNQLCYSMYDPMTDHP